MATQLRRSRVYSTQRQPQSQNGKDGTQEADNGMDDNTTGLPFWFRYFLISSIAATAGYIAATLDDAPKVDEAVEMSKYSTLPLSVTTPPIYNTDPIQVNDLFNKLKAVLDNNPENFTTNAGELQSHADSDFNTKHPDSNQRLSIVLFPRSTQDVSRILALCNEYHVPVVPFSGGTSLEGHFLPTRTPCVSIDLSKYMNKIIRFNAVDQDVTVEAGLPWEFLNEYLRPEGFMFGCDPGPGAELGGAIATACSGTNAFRYGTIKDQIINLTVVLPDGTVIKTRRRPRKSAAGYNLNGLFVGSEGTLGIITEATVKCHLLPKVEDVLVASFPSVKEAAACCSDIISNGIRLNAMELLDENIMKLVNKNETTTRTDWLEAPTLFLKVGGESEAVVNELLANVKEISKKHKVQEIRYAREEEEKEELWGARKVALWSVLDYGKIGHPDAKIWTTDVAVPLSNFARVIEETKEDLKESELVSAVVGHAGDGNFHALIVYRDDDELRKCREIVHRMVRRALDAEGTCTGEHGVGIGKRGFLREELGEHPIDLMRKIKLAIDPNRIMNPDKIFSIDPREARHVEDD